MRASRPELRSQGLGVALRRLGTGLREAVLLAGPIAALEAVGPLTFNDGFDLMVFFGASLLAIALGQAARVGWMPFTVGVLSRMWQYVQSTVRRRYLSYAIGFRPTPGVRIIPDRTLAVPTVLMAAALVVLGALGPLAYEGLTWMREHVAYTPYLLVLVAIWTTMLVTVLLCGFFMQRLLARMTRSNGGSPFPYFLTFIAWIVGMVALAMIPGAFAVLAVLVIGWYGSRGLGALPQHDYLFCRRDADGEPRAIPVQTYMRQVYTAAVFALALVVVVGQADRLWESFRPHAPYEFTGWMGLMASLAAIILSAFCAAYVRRIAQPSVVPPEVPLTPTLWIERSLLREFGGEEEQQETYWYRVARERGWLVLRDAHEPDHAWDLVMGSDGHARRFEPREPLDENDAAFQLERRLHVVMRRRFRREFESLFKALRSEAPEGGTGFLVCPHVWLVPGVVRDVAPADHQGSSGALVGPRRYGPPMMQAFDPRVRRYIGQVLRKLEIDVMFLEDSITWKDVRRVLGVMFETYDQGRAPLRERHFVGLPRVRVVIQEEAADAEPPKAIPAGDPFAGPDAMAGMTRVLLITRDRGDKDEIEELDPVDFGVKSPSLV